jgi:hypothetical protein
VRITLSAALLLGASVCAADDGTCYRDNAGALHCQNSSGTSVTGYTDPIGTTHYQSSDGQTGTSYVDPNGTTRYQTNNVPSVNAQSQYELQQQLERNRYVPPASNGWSRAGANMFGSPQRANDAFYQGMMQGIAARQAMEAAQRAQVEAADAQITRDIESNWRIALTREWKAYGLNDEEAHAVANNYKFIDSQIAITEHVKSKGWQSGLHDAIAAYKAYNYLLADQLIVAAYMASNSESQQQEQK